MDSNNALKGESLLYIVSIVALKGFNYDHEAVTRNSSRKV